MFNIFIGIIVVAIIYVVFIYNKFVSLTNRTKEAWADIDVQLKRRYDLIPNLIESVKGYVTHEKDTLERVTALRTKAMDATGMEEKGKTENMLTGALKSLFAVSENYPDLKANQNFIELQKELSDTENKIQAARRFYNSNVRDLNIGLESFPQNFVGNLFKFAKQEFFELEEGSDAKEVVKVEF